MMGRSRSGKGCQRSSPASHQPGDRLGQRSPVSKRWLGAPEAACWTRRKGECGVTHTRIPCSHVNGWVTLGR